MKAEVAEDAWTFDCAGEQLLGVVSTPPPGTVSTGTAVVIVVGGPQYRAGAHRQFVQLARTLAQAGHSVLRFDPRGLGDSSGTRRGFEDISDDIRAAICTVRARLPAVRRLVLFGLCDGASAALLCLHQGASSSVDGLCLLNPWVRSEATLAQAHLKHYYWHRLTDVNFWRKVLVGGVGIGQWHEFVRAWRLTRCAKKGRAAERTLDFREAMADAWRDYRGDVLLMLSEDDLTAREFVEHAQTADEWRDLLERPTVQRVHLAGADHTLSTEGALEACADALRRWLVSTANVSTGATA